jgi:putative oxidoreductase
MLLIAGLLSRPVSLLLTCSMFVAYWTADREALLAVFSDPGKFYAADPFTFLFAALLILAFGPGLFSLDALIARRFRPYRGAGLLRTTHWETDAVSG